MSVDKFAHVREGFGDHSRPEAVVDEVLAAFVEAKRRFHRDDLRPQAIEGGLFSEGVLRLLQFEATGRHMPLNVRNFKVDTVIGELEKVTAASDSVRFHIPRAVRLIYGIRSSRDNTHLMDGIDPNLQDASLVLGCMDWILAELVRIAHSVSPEEAQAMIADIVKKEVPAIEVAYGRPFILRDVSPTEEVAVLLYWAGVDGTSEAALRGWLSGSRRKHLARTLDTLQAQHMVIRDGAEVRLSGPGLRDVERRDLLKPL